MSTSYEISLNVPSSATSSTLAIGTTAAGSAAFPGNGGMGTTVVFTPSVDCYVRQGATVAVVADGTDMLVRGGMTYRAYVAPGNKLNFITATGTGSVSMTPNA